MWVAVPLGGVVTVGAVVVRRGGGVGVICDEVVVEPPASAAAGIASKIPTEAMEAANLDFTGFRNVDEWRIASRPDEIVCNMRAFFKR
jgi:hypothetical protein